MAAKISVIVPVYKVEPYITRCLDSITNQTYRNLEIILVDDGSPDRCGEICDEYASQDSRIRVIHKSNGGLSDARNYGIDVATGDYLAFVDSDDYIATDMYEKMLGRLQQDDSDMVICNYYRFNEGSAPEHGYINLPDRVLLKDEAFDFYLQIGGDYVSAWNKLYKRGIFADLRYPIGKIYEDTFVICEVLNRCARISHMNDPFYYYVMRSGSILHATFSVKNLDIGEAFINQYHFAKRMNLQDFRDYCCNKLSYRFEEWKPKVKGDKLMQKRFNALKRKALFLLFEKDAWKYYSIKGKIMARIRFLF